MYVFDTSSFIVLGHYFPDIFTTLWDGFNECVSSGEVISCREVYRELDNQVSSNHLKDWINDNRDVFYQPAPEELALVAQFFQNNQYRNLVRSKQILKGTPVADPFLIASAQVKWATIVTEESYKENAARIPTLCRDIGIDCMNLNGFMIEKGWRF